MLVYWPEIAFVLTVIFALGFCVGLLWEAKNTRRAQEAFIAWLVAPNQEEEVSTSPVNQKEKP